MNKIRARRFLPLLVLPLLAACSDQRATFEIQDRDRSLSLIRVTQWPWDSKAQYAIVASRMPDCMRRHALPDAGLDSPVEIFAPGNDAWIVRQEGRMYVTETRTCEGFAPLAKAPDGGLGPLAGTFRLRSGTLVFEPAPKPVAPPAPPPPPPPAPAAESAPAAVPPAAPANQ